MPSIKNYICETSPTRIFALIVEALICQIKNLQLNLCILRGPMRIFIFIFFCYASPFQLYASLVDPFSINDSIAKADSLNQLAFKVKRNDINRALGLLYKASALSEKCNYQKGITTSLIYEAGIYQQHGHSKKALSLYYKALDLSSRNKDTLNNARARQLIGNAMFEEKRLPEAERLYKEALSGFEHLHRVEDMINIRNALGLVKMAQKDTRKAESYFRQAGAESIRAGYPYGKKKSEYSLGLLFMQKMKLDQAKDFFNSAISLNKQNNDKYGLALNKNKLSEVAALEGNHERSRQLAFDAYKDAKSISAISVAVEAIENLIRFYKRDRNQDKVIEWQNILITEQKLLFEKEKTYASNFLDIIKDRQEEQIRSQKEVLTAQQNAKYSWTILIILAIALLVLASLIFQLQKNYRKAKLFSKELTEKNIQIGDNLKSLNLLNEAILKQNSSLEESNAMKDKLLSILSHDLRLPLSSTKSIIDLMNEGLLSEEDSKQLFIELEAQYLRVITLLDNLLFWIKGQMKGTETAYENIEIRKLITGVIDELNVALVKKNISVRETLKDGLIISGHSEMLKVVFRNLLSNAIKYTSGGVIAVYFSMNKGLYIHVKDDGLGMSAENLLKVKSRTYFTTYGTNKEYGSGFGLMICKDLIQNHQGELLIESEPGKGSVFTVKFPEHLINYDSIREG